MHGQMYTDTETSPHSATAPVAFSGYIPCTSPLAKPGLAIIENTLLANRYREPVNRPFQFSKRSQLIIRTLNETLPVAAMGVRSTMLR